MLNYQYYIHFRNPSSPRPPRQQYTDPATLGTKKGIIVFNTPIYPVSQGTWNILHHKIHIKCLCDIKFLLICLKTKRTKMDISLCNGYVIISQCSPLCTSKTHYCQTVGILSTPFYSALAQKSASTHGTTCMMHVCKVFGSEFSNMCSSKTHHCQTVGKLSTPFYSALTQVSASTHGATCICMCICKYTDAGYI